MNQVMTIGALAGETSKLFETATRIGSSGETFTRLAGDTSQLPFWVTDMVYHAHGDKLSSDWIYETIVSCLDAIAGENASDDDEAIEAIEAIAPEIYTGALLDWLKADYSRIVLVDDAQDNGVKGLIEAIQAAQAEAIREIGAVVVTALAARLEELNA